MSQKQGTITGISNGDSQVLFSGSSLGFYDINKSYFLAIAGSAMAMKVSGWVHNTIQNTYLISLAEDYTGATIGLTSCSLHENFTPNFKFPILRAGDSGLVPLLNSAFSRLDSTAQIHIVTEATAIVDDRLTSTQAAQLLNSNSSFASRLNALEAASAQILSTMTTVTAQLVVLEGKIGALELQAAAGETNMNSVVTTLNLFGSALLTEGILQGYESLIPVSGDSGEQP